MQNTQPEDELYVNSSIDDNGRPLVVWGYMGRSGSISVTAAREQAKALLQAAAIAESEAAIITGLRSFDSKPQGFARKEDQEREKFIAKVLGLVRTFRQPLAPGLSVIFGAATRVGIVVLDESWYGCNLQMDVTQTQEQAFYLLGCAEAAESDAFLYHFQQSVGIDYHEGQRMIQAFAQFRQRNSLEELYRNAAPGSTQTGQD